MQMEGIIMVILGKISMKGRDFICGIRLSISLVFLNMGLKWKGDCKVQPGTKGSLNTTEGMGMALAGTPRAKYIRVDGKQIRDMGKDLWLNLKDPNLWEAGFKAREKVKGIYKQI